MKEYPSISSSVGQQFREIPHAYVFDKLDGSNLRIERNKKRGWYKFGTRTRLFDQTDPDFGSAIELFKKTLEEPLTKIVRDEQLDQVVVFCEFWGAKSFAGKHQPDEPKHMTLFDIAVHKRGILGPKEFLRLTKHLDPPLVPYYLGQFNWTRDFVGQVRNEPLIRKMTSQSLIGQTAPVTVEGVVGKAGDGKTHDLVMAKAKTQAWVDAVLAQYGEIEGKKIVES